MYKLLVIVPILGWVGVGVLLHQSRDWLQPDAGDSAAAEAATVVLAPRVPVAAPPATQQVPMRALPHPADRAAIARSIQTELRRVGCFDGEVTGIWNAASRQAMRRFTDRANAKLPIDEPDVVLLRLVQNHGQRACGACPAGQEEARDGTCVATAAAKKPIAEANPGGSVVHKSSVPMVAGAAATAAATATSALPHPEAKAAPARARQASGALLPDDDEDRDARSVRENGPIPPAAINEPRRRSTQRRSAQPPAAMRALVRDVQRALGSLGIR